MRSEPRFDWSDDAVARLKEHITAGMSASEIVRELVSEFGGPLTRNAVIGKVARIGLALRGVPQPRKPAPPRPPRDRRVIIRRPPPAAAAPKPAPAAAPAVLPAGGGVKLLDLREHHCRWPYGDPQRPDFRFCGCERDPRAWLPFCEAHFREGTAP